MKTIPETVPANTAPARQQDARRRRHGFTPLVRAALDNGIDYASVEAYALRGPERVPALEPVCDLSRDLSRDLDAELTDAALDAALARSVLAVGTIEHARLFWRGVL